MWLTMFTVSSAMLILVIVRHRLSWGWAKRLAIHLSAAAFVLFLLNYLGLVPGLHVPLNPATIGTVVALGVPGIALILGLQIAILP